MNRKHEDADVDAAVNAMAEAETERVKLSAEAAKLGDLFLRLGNALKNHPETVVFRADGFQGPFMPTVVVHPADLDVDRLRRLVSAIRNESLKLRDARTILSKSPCLNLN
jgi:hypothetical protein